MESMNSTFCYHSKINSTIYSPNTTIHGSFNFTATFFQPFIDITPGNVTGEFKLCGPLLGILIEFAKRIKFSLGYHQPFQDQDEFHYRMLRDNMSNAILYPYPPINLTRIEQLKFTRAVGFTETVSVLSSRARIEAPLFVFMNSYTFVVWVCILFSVLTLCLVHFCVTAKGCEAYLISILSQPIPRMPHKSMLKYFLLNWIVVSAIIVWSFKAVLLTNLMFKIPYSQIDTLEDLADRNIPFLVFSGETAQEFINQEDSELTRRLLKKLVVEDPPSEAKKEWEIKTMRRLSAGKYAMVSDKPFLDFYHARFLGRYPNLYRSQESYLTLPYYIPFSKHNSKHLEEIFEKTVVHLTESDIYNFWTRQTIEMNRKVSELIDDGEDYRYRRLSFKHIKGLFLLYIIFTSTSILVFTVEFFFKPCISNYFIDKK